MEIGNLVFGNSRGEYPIKDKELWEPEFHRLLVAVQPNKEWPDVVEFENEIFWLFPYYWGDCTCGWDFIDNGHQKLQNLKHRPDCYRHEYKRVYNETRGDHDKQLALLKPIFKKYGWDTESENWWHGCAIRCTCDYDDRYNAIIEEYAKEFGRMGHKPDCLLLRDNFHYKPTGFGIQWYKHPFRDSYMNQNISVFEFRRIIDICIASIQKHGEGK